MHMVTSGNSGAAVDECLQSGQATLIEYLKYLLPAIVEIYKEIFLKVLTKEERKKLLQRGLKLAIPGVIGSVHRLTWAWKNTQLDIIASM